ncbi:hypothetical protein MKW94_021658 [Papaver nudicaule]|uniref:BRCT domain-containing protein n=1 Tax=Papaver nudicaule TaxID=74823 RepID=A0AA41VLM0_PAPNU|nr:hypothetical protein [Papaver nudicaule]
MFGNRTRFLIRGNKIDKKKNQERNDVKCADINKDAIELSIAASEALVISEIIKEDSASFPAATIVDIALCVKKARNSVCSDGLDCISDFVATEVDETYLLSDLDEDDMAAAFEDVGLSSTQLDTICCSSSVKNNKCSSFRISCDGEAQNVDARPQMFDYNDIYCENKLEDALAMGSNFSKYSPGYVHKQKLQDDPSLALKTHYHQSVHNNRSTLEIPEGVEAIVDLEVNTTKAIPKFFIAETSFLSESADVVRDENLIAPNPGFMSQIASLSSVAYDGFRGTANSERIEVSQNICSSDSLTDLLCSVVPCSISQTNTDVMTTSQKIEENGAGKNWYTQLRLENSLPSTRRLNYKYPHGEDVFLNVNGEGSTVSCHRRLTSLNTYSTLGLSLAANSEGMVDCFKPSLKDPTKFLFSESCVCEYYDRDHDGPAIANPAPIWPESKGNTGVVSVQSAARAEMTEFKILTGFDSQRKISSLSPYDSTQNLNGREDLDPARKRVRFSDAEIIFEERRFSQKLQSAHEMRSRITRARKRSKGSSLLSDLRCEEVNTCRSTWKIMDKTKTIFLGLEFLLTGFSSQRQTKLGALISRHGGFVLSEVPSPSRGMKGSKCKHRPLPIVISSRKVGIETPSSRLIFPLRRYIIFSHQCGSKFARIGWPVCCNKKTRIFDGVGIMLHGRSGFCNKFAKVVKHGGGQLFKTLQWLIQSLKTESISLGAIVAEDEGRTSRHLRQCASEQRLQIMPVSWIVNSLHLGQLLPIEEKHQFSSPPKIKFPELFSAMEQCE